MKANDFSYNTVKILLVLLAFAGIKCNDNPISPVKVSLYNDFDIKYGQTAYFSDDSLSITFKDVADGRCPIGLVCVWAGSAYITLKLQQNEMMIIDTVQTFTPEKLIKIGTTNNYYKFTVKKLAPYPVYQKEIVKEKYILTLNVAKIYIR